MIPRRHKTEKKILPKLKDKFRLVIMNDETYEEVGSYRLSPLNLYLLLCTLIVLGFLLALSVVAYTPFKRLLPGFGWSPDHPDYLKVTTHVQNLESQVLAQQLYIDNFKKWLTGEATKDKTWEYKGDDPTKDFLNQSQNGLRNLINVYLTPPVKGEIIAEFVPLKKHYGVDILTTKNTKVLAPLDGKIIKAYYNIITGNTLMIQHSDGIVTQYQYNSALLKRVGDEVKAGDGIAIVGQSGTKSDGSNLHFELWKEGEPLDPLNYINFK
ncbi:MAG: M23 family metallopeptidase [Saprospiraceae bacterium]|jgi:murein DD-endopeptidase MepM/ murein hydrolase activator NlpD|nr:M23 family metallopeptidase [Saprospiraceae bacterium]